VEPVTEEKNDADSAPASRTGIRLMIAIVVGVALVALYANVQKSRRNQIEQVTITPAAAVTPAPAATAGPKTE
jgi:hypothetical protein